MAFCSLLIMASNVFILFSFSFLITISSAAQRPHFPRAAAFPVRKDPTTLQYVTRIDIGTPLDSVYLVVDIGGSFTWVYCGSKRISSSHNLISSTSLQCTFAKINLSFNPQDDTGICTLCPHNGITGMGLAGWLAEDFMAVELIQGPIIDLVRDKRSVLFSCAPDLLLDGLANGVKGMLGLGKTRFSLPSQLSVSYGFNRKFALCLSGSEGVISIGDGPYLSSSGADLSKSLMYTSFASYQDGSLEDYTIYMKSIKINGKRLSINSTTDKSGVKISTIIPYTTMESTIYEAFTQAYAEAGASMNISIVEPVSPFGLCFNLKGVEMEETGPAVPVIDLVLQSEMVKWRIHGRNSMVKVSDDVMCLGVLDGGLSPKNSIVIGGYQLEDNLLEFNLATSMLGFSSSLLTSKTSCSDLGSYTTSVEQSLSLDS